MKKVNGHSEGVWTYLEKIGILEHGTDAEIKAARKAYFQEYRRKWNKENRIAYTISLNKKQSKEVQASSKLYGLKPCTFIKKALLAYIHQTTVFPNEDEIQELKALLTATYCKLQTLEESSNIHAANSILPAYSRLEEQILDFLSSKH